MQKDIDFYYKKNRLSQIRGFCSVVQNGCSISRAHEKTHIELSTLSKEIRTLEKDLGVDLFDRSGYNRLKLTIEGELFYKEAVQYVNGIDGLVESFNKQLKEFNDNHLNIASHYTAATYIFPDIISNLLKDKKFKNINIEIMEITRDDAIARLKEKKVDLIYYPFDIDYEIPTEFNAIRNIRNSNAIILSKNHPLVDKKKIMIEDLKKYDFITRGKNISFKIDKYLNLKHANISFENCSIDTSIEFARAVNGITGIPEKIYKLGNLKYNPNIVCKNINHLFQESYFQILTLKNSIKKDSTKFIIEELEKLNKILG